MGSFSQCALNKNGTYGTFQLCMSRNIGRTVGVVISGWEVISDGTVVYFNCIYFSSFL